MAGASGPGDGPLDLSDLRAEEVPLALADRHRAMAVGERLHARLPDGGGPNWAADQVHGAGFDLVSAAHGPPSAPIGIVALRARTLPDYVGAGMVLLICGLNPSLYAADAGVGFARPGNRFWPALLAAEMATADRDPRRLLVDHRIGMTDLVKRATTRADALTTDEYRTGIARLGRRCAALRPAAVCVVGFDGWRRVVDRKAVAGWQPTGAGGRPVYLMPNPSGLNAHTRLDGFVAHLRAACRTPDGGACS